MFIVACLEQIASVCLMVHAFRPSSDNEVAQLYDFMSDD